MENANDKSYGINQQEIYPNDSDYEEWLLKGCKKAIEILRDTDSQLN